MLILNALRLTYLPPVSLKIIYMNVDTMFSKLTFFYKVVAAHSRVDCFVNQCYFLVLVTQFADFSHTFKETI